MSEVTIDDLLAEITAREKTVRILLRQDLIAEHARLDDELVAAAKVDATENRDPVGPALAERILELEAEIEAAKRLFRFRAVGKKAWADLIAQHPPTPEQLKGHGRLDHNPETFPVAAIAASCIGPKMTVEQVAKLELELNLAQFEILWSGCLDANVGGSDSPKSLVAPLIVRMNDVFETTAVNGASRDRSSSVE